MMAARLMGLVQEAGKAKRTKEEEEEEKKQNLDVEGSGIDFESSDFPMWKHRSHESAKVQGHNLASKARYGNG
jgi:hypothetical protein